MTKLQEKNSILEHECRKKESICQEMEKNHENCNLKVKKFEEVKSKN